MLAQIIQVLEKYIRPQLQLHDGDIEILNFDKDTKQLRLRLMGQCCACPSSMDTIENLIKVNLKSKVGGLEDIIVETGLSDEMIELAKKYLRLG